ncbi:MAG: (2Fe-2S)-binding protein [Sneathiella sp.]
MRLTLNKMSVSVPNDWREHRLLWVLRDHFKLIGPKYGCGIGECGACSIHVDGEVQRSCSLTLEDVEGAEVTTLEGLRISEDQLHPVQEAWIAENVPQCGYCQNGQIMTAAALLSASNDAKASEIEAVMDTVRCRCGTQARIKKAIARAREAMKTS